MAKSIVRKEGQTPDEGLMPLFKKHFVDEEGMMVVEAATFCVVALKLMSDINEIFSEAMKSGDSDLVNEVKVLLASLITEHSSKDIYADSSSIDFVIANIKETNLDVGVMLQKMFYGNYSELMNNEFYNLPASNVILRVLLVESVTRMIAVSYFSNLKGGQKTAIANGSCAYHFIPMIAYMTSADLQNYLDCFEETERYFSGMLGRLEY